MFTSDNWAGVHPTIMDAMVSANGVSSPAYGADDITERANKQFTDLFGQKITAAYVATGSAANALSIALMVKPWGAVLCHKESHIHVDECGASEFYTGGAKLIPVEGERGKLTPHSVREAMRFFIPPQTHRVRPMALSLTQGTEAGTVYTPDDVAVLTEVAREFGLLVHMDGARLSNACAYLDESPAAVSSNAGVDILTFGGTKNGCLAAEAILVFNNQLADDLTWRQKRAGQGFSKSRFLAAQWLGFLQDDLWLELARAANEKAARLSKALVTRPGCKVIYPTEMNEVFVQMSGSVAEALRAKGAQFYDWIQPQDPYDGTLRRLVTSYQTTDDEVDAFLKALESA